MIAAPSFAQEETKKNTGFSIQPAFQNIVISNSKPVVDTKILIENTTQQAETFEVFAIEFPSAQHFGSLQFIDFNQTAIKQQPNYVTFDANQFVLNPQEKREVLLRISDRVDLRPGGTYATVVIRAVTKNIQAQQPVIPAFSSMLLIRKIDGEIRNLSLIGMSNNTHTFGTKIPDVLELTFQNNGNVHLIPRGQVIVEDIFGKIIKQGILNEESTYVLPDTQKNIPVKLQKSSWTLPLMLLTIKAFGTSETTSYATEYSYLYISPILIFGLLILALLLFFLLYKKKQKKATHV